MAALEEHVAAASITTVPKTFAWAAGSVISAYFLTLSAFGWSLIGDATEAAHDVLLLVGFQNVRPLEIVEAIGSISGS